jgi:cation diffusion facilitator family transporter
MVLKARKYYNRDRKPEIGPKEKTIPSCCALEHHKTFKRKIDIQNAAMKKLFFVSCICFIFMGCEFAGGIISGSLAILADAAHMFSDVAGFMISFFSIYLSKRKQTFNHGYGYHRSEVLGALMSIFLIWGLLVWLNYEAVNRLITPPEDINADIMLITACIGFLCNVTNFIALNYACKAPEDDED